MVLLTNEKNRLCGLVLQIQLSEVSTACAADHVIADLAREIRRRIRDILPADALVATSLIIEGQAKPTPPCVDSPKSINRHSEGPASGSDAATMRPSMLKLEIDTGHKSVQLNGRDIRFTHMEMQLFLHLIHHAPRIVDRKELLASVWESSLDEPRLRAVDVHVRRMRQKLGPFADVIRSARGQGYYFQHGDNIVVHDQANESSETVQPRLG